MALDVRLFAAAAARLAPTLTVDLKPPTTVSAVRAALQTAHPEHSDLLKRCSIAVNLEVATEDLTIGPHDEVAILPPFAGGADDVRVIIDVCPAPLDVTGTLAATAHPATGAHVVFLGTVRDHSPDRADVERLDYSAYVPMATKVMHEIADELREQWPSLKGIALVHAVGELDVGDHTVLVVCSSPHRDDAYMANRHALEALKQRVPVWKHEVGADGDGWVGVDR